MNAGGYELTRPYRDTGRVRVGRGSEEIDQPSCWAGAVTPKTARTSAEKSKLLLTHFNISTQWYCVETVCKV